MKRGGDCPVRLRLGEGGHVVADSGVGPCLGPVASLIAAEHYEQGHWLGGVREGYADLGEVRLHYVEAGDGPLVVLLHGFPEFWYAEVVELDASHGVAVSQPERVTGVILQAVQGTSSA